MLRSSKNTLLYGVVHDIPLFRPVGVSDGEEYRQGLPKRVG
jgi:hypothetical protein